MTFNVGNFIAVINEHLIALVSLKMSIKMCIFFLNLLIKRAQLMNHPLQRALVQRVIHLYPIFFFTAALATEVVNYEVISGH